MLCCSGGVWKLCGGGLLLSVGLSGKAVDSGGGVDLLCDHEDIFLGRGRWAGLLLGGAVLVYVSYLYWPKFSLRVKY